MLSRSGTEKFAELITNQGKSGESVTTGEGGTAEELFRQCVKEENPNKHCHTSYCRRTFENYVRKLNLTSEEAALRCTSDKSSTLSHSWM